MKHALRAGVLLGMLAGCVGETAELGPTDRPARPSLPDDGTDTGELVFRLADFRFAAPPLSGYEGRNLDGFVTDTSGAATQCAPPSGAQPPQDSAGGVDNVFYEELGPIIDLVAPCAQSELQNEQLLGRGTLLLRIEGWNGTENDSAVTASLVVAADGTSANLDDLMWDASTHQLVLASDSTTPAADPVGDASDHYIARPDSFEGGGTTARLRDTNAYLAGGVLVFAMPARADVPLNAGTTSLLVRMTDGLLLAELAADFSSIRAGSLSGRYGLVDFLDGASALGICGATQLTVETQLSGLLDVRSDPSAPPGGECDAMSFGFPFTGVPATLATNAGAPMLAGSNPPFANACDDEGAMLICP